MSNSLICSLFSKSFLSLSNSKSLLIKYVESNLNIILFKASSSLVRRRLQPNGNTYVK